MKKILTVLLALAMCLSLCACGKSAEDLYEESPNLSLSEAGAEIDSNKARAKELYDGKTFVVKAFVQEIESKEVYLTSGSGFLAVSFKDKEDMLEFSQGDTITVVGKIKVLSFQSGMEMKQAVLIEVDKD